LVWSRPYELLYQDYGDEMRGCHTKEDIYDDEVIIEVPLKCLITVEMGKETEVITVFCDAKKCSVQLIGTPSPTDWPSNYQI
jgi:hypothetical protein